MCHLGYQPPYTNDPNNPQPASEYPSVSPTYEPPPPPPHYPGYQPGYQQQAGSYPPPPAPPSQPLYPPPPGYGQQPYPPYAPYAPYGDPGYPPPAAPSQPLYPPPPGYGPGYGTGYGQPPMGYGAPPYPAEQGSGMAIAGLILGIVAIPAASFAACGFIFGVLGLIFSIQGRKSYSHRTMATVGIVLSSIALALALIQILGGIVSSLNLMPG